jgi:hypothetical protein
MFALNFSLQNAAFLVGLVVRAQPSCRCQKHPWTNTTHRLARLAKSGLPGRSRLCTRNRRPKAWASLRTASSAEVPLCLIRPMRAEVAGSVTGLSFGVAYFAFEGIAQDFMQSPQWLRVVYVDWHEETKSAFANVCGGVARNLWGSAANWPLRATGIQRLLCVTAAMV